MPAASRYRSRDDIGARVVFIPRSGKLLAAALAVVVVAVVLWSIVGSARTLVTGNGIIVPAGQEVFDVQGTSAGRVIAIKAHIGDRVDAGQTVIDIAPSELDVRAKLARQMLFDLEADLADYRQRLAGEAKAHEDASAARLELLQGAVATAEKQQKALQTQLGTEGPAGEGLRLSDQELTTRMASIEAQITSVQNDLVDYRASQAQLVADREHRIFEQRLTIKDVEAQLALASELRAPSQGVVQELHIHKGQVIQPGEVLMTVASGGRGYEALAFIPPNEGGRIVKGMAAHVLPATVKKSEYGFMRGTVTSVSPGPVSLAALDTLLGDRELAASFMTAGPPYICRIELATDDANPSGFAWLAGRGPPFAVTPGVLASVEIIVREQAPITLVMPALGRSGRL